MGSSGSGKFGTYRVGNGQNTGRSGNSAGGGVGGGAGGGNGEIECPSSITNIRLEDVASSDYYSRSTSVPPSGEPIVLHNAIYRGRLVVKAASGGEILGNLPTQYNYLINCIKSGMNYTGVVVSSGKLPVPYIVVTLNA